MRTIAQLIKNPTAMHALTVSILDYDVRNPSHKKRFAALNREWLERYFHVEGHDEAVFADPKSAVLDKGGVILMAQVDDAIVGTGSLFALEPRVFEVAKMAVTEAYQARGIGERLLAALMDCARGKGAAKLFIVSNTRLENAIRLYRRHGFKNSDENRHEHYARGNITLEKLL